jgi:hypothetical protein
VAAARSNFAVTIRSLVRVSEQVVPELESQPVQLPSVEPPAGVAVSETAVPSGSWTEQDDPQSMPFPETVPEPDPVAVTLREWFWPPGVKVAVTVLSEPSVRVHVAPDVESHPDHPAKLEPGSATAERLTAVPVDSVEVHVLPQAIPLPLTVPEPVPALTTVRTLVLVPGLPEPPPQASQTRPSIAVESAPQRGVRCMMSPRGAGESDR